MYLIYEDTAEYDTWLKLILTATLALTLVMGILFVPVDLAASGTMFGVTAFDALLFHSILPRRYQVFQDKVRIVLGRPFAFDLPFPSIKEIRVASSSKAFAYWGIRLATSSKSVVEIVRRKDWNMLISPTHTDAFLIYVNQALETVTNSERD